MEKHGFQLIKQEKLSEVGGMANLWEHIRTGAQLLSVCNADENKSFGVTFCTPPQDSTGVAHILEHSVLCGSEKYPVKEPFVELLKSSLQTFLNAMTFPDKTCYPVASTNVQDFYNLVDVYLDAVFYPRITEDTLRQEGWHVAPSPQSLESDKVWEFKGVVYNEMKGVYSSPDSVLMEQSQHSVFPDTLYSLDSGGRPEEILNLTYAQFKSFHETYYHPSNGLFFFWGDDAEDLRLQKIDLALQAFERSTNLPNIPLQARRDMPRKIEALYTADGEDGGSHVTINWLLCESGNVEELMILDMLEHILTGLPTSPLRKALMDSGLGEDLAGAGLESDLRQAYYSLGLRSIAAENAEEVERLMLECMADLAEQGIDPKATEAALNSLEFVLRENNTGRFPRGLEAMLRCLNTWLYGGDPFAPLAWEKYLDRVKTRLASGEKLFEQALHHYFLDNNHRTMVLLMPDASLEEKKTKQEAASLAALVEGYSKAELEALAANSIRLQEAQEAADSPEALASIPSLTLEDMEPKAQTIPSTVEKNDQFTLYKHAQETTGIVYASMLFPLEGLPQRLLPLLSLYTRALTEMLSPDLALELSAKTGSLGADTALHNRIQDGQPLFFMSFGAKATASKLDDMTRLMAQVLFQPNLEDRDRFTQMVLEEKARMEVSLVPSGHGVVATRLGAAFSSAGCLAELTSGIEYLYQVRELASRVVENWDSVQADLQELHSLIVRRPGLIMNITAEENLLPRVSALMQDLAQLLPQTALAPQSWPLALNLSPEALLVPAQVNYVGLGSRLHAPGQATSGSWGVVMRYLRMGYLWDRVRVQGGAYGCMVRYSRTQGTLAFLSYRDPNVARTLDVYRATPDYLAHLKLSQAELVRAIVGTIGDMDSYMLPSAKGSTSLWRQLCGEDNQLRQRLRDEILSTTLGDFHDMAPLLAKAQETALPIALGGQALARYASQNGWNSVTVLS